MVSRNTIPRFRQFSLRFGVGFFLAICILFGFGARWYHDMRARGEAQRRLVELSKRQPEGAEAFIFVGYAAEKTVPWSTSLMRTWVHPEASRRIAILSVSGEKLDKVKLIEDVRNTYDIESINVTCGSMTTEFAAVLFGAPGLQKLLVVCDLGEAPRSDEYLLSLRVATDLKTLVLKTPLLSETGSSYLSLAPELSDVTLFACTPKALGNMVALPKLEQLTIEAIVPSNSDRPGELAAALGKLAEHPRLSSLSLSGRLPIEPLELDQFCQRSRIKHLTLRHAELNADALAQFAQLPRLEKLEVYDEALIDEDFMMLLSAKHLRSLLIGPKVSDEGITLMRQKLPQCKIQKF